MLKIKNIGFLWSIVKMAKHELRFTMHKLQLAGPNLGQVFSFNSGNLHTSHLWHYWVKLPKLKLKTWTKQLLVSPLLDIVLTNSTLEVSVCLPHIFLGLIAKLAVQKSVLGNHKVFSCYISLFPWGSQFLDICSNGWSTFLQSEFLAELTFKSVEYQEYWILMTFSWHG